MFSSFRKRCDLQLVLATASDLLNKLAEDVGLGGELVQLGRGETTLPQDAVQTSQLLRGKVVVLAQLVEHAQVVLGILDLGLLLQLLSLLLGVGSSLGKRGAASEPGDDVVECLESAGNSIKTAACNTVGTGLLVDVGNDVALGSTAVIVDSLLAAGREELDGGI